MKKRSIAITLLGSCVLAFGIWQQSRVPVVPTGLSFSIGQSFEEVVKASSYSVIEHSNVPTHAYLQAGETFVTEPAVILLFNDPQHGFKLPPTKFAMVSYMDNRVNTVATTPLLESLPFKQVVAVMENLQDQFKFGGWEPWKDDGSTWFDFTIAGREKLYAQMFQPGFSREATLRVPGKYGMTFRLWCAQGCRTRQPPYLFMIDIGVGNDIERKIQSHEIVK